ncbi:MAG TPA: ACT domain-containing protein [Candidatus Methylomirabilis sp.]|nr:ACT domain-containing protein [Candidatus Methylomirabilis sp.]
MHKKFVLTLTGPDRIGFVENVTGLLLERGGNVETSRMARLGGEFAILMLVSMPAEQFSSLENDLEILAGSGHKVTTTPAEQTYAEAYPGWLPYRIEVQGADHEGIIHEIAHYLSEQGISIEAADSESTPAPTSGVPLFAMMARVIVPPNLSRRAWEAGLEEIGDRMNLDIRVADLRDR